jgi:hypothetical protein
LRLNPFAFTEHMRALCMKAFPISCTLEGKHPGFSGLIRHKSLIINN